MLHENTSGISFEGLGIRYELRNGLPSRILSFSIMGKDCVDKLPKVLQGVVMVYRDIKEDRCWHEFRGAKPLSEGSLKEMKEHNPTSPLEREDRMVVLDRSCTPEELREITELWKKSPLRREIESRK